jgi:hypothetical protein
MNLYKFLRETVILASIPFLILSNSCSSQHKSNNNDSLLSDFRIKSDLGYQLINSENLDSSNVIFKDFTYQYHNKRDKVFIYDKSSRKQLIYNTSSGLMDVVDQDTYLETPFIPTSITENDSIQYVLYFHQFTIAKVNKGTGFVKDIPLEDFSQQSIHSDKHRFEVLENGNFLIPTAINVLSDSKFYKQSLSDGLDKVMEEQYLFHLYGKSGQLLRKFGKSPRSNLINDTSLPLNQHYMYVVKDGFIYVTFPIGQELYKYDYNGNLIDAFEIELPEFNYAVKSGERGNDAKIDLAIEKESDQEVLYIHTINYINKNKIKHFIYKLNLLQKKLEYGEIMNGNNYMLPYIYNDTISFLKKTC